jgi:hypothetical protein
MSAALTIYWTRGAASSCMQCILHVPCIAVVMPDVVWLLLLLLLLLLLQRAMDCPLRVVMASHGQDVMHQHPSSTTWSAMEHVLPWAQLPLQKSVQGAVSANGM